MPEPTTTEKNRPSLFLFLPHQHTPFRPHPRLRRPRLDRQGRRHLRPHGARQAALQEDGGRRRTRDDDGDRLWLLAEARRRRRPGEARASPGRAGEGPLLLLPGRKGRERAVFLLLLRTTTGALVLASAAPLEPPAPELGRRLDVVAARGGRGGGAEAQARSQGFEEGVGGERAGPDRGAQRGAAVCGVEGADWLKKGKRERKFKDFLFLLLAMN